MVTGHDLRAPCNVLPDVLYCTALSPQYRQLDGSTFTFTRNALIQRLVNILSRHSDPQIHATLEGRGLQDGGRAALQDFKVLWVSGLLFFGGQGGAAGWGQGRVAGLHGAVGESFFACVGELRAYVQLAQGLRDGAGRGCRTSRCCRAESTWL